MSLKSNILFALILNTFVSCSQDRSDQAYVVMVSIDGFRHDYAKKYEARHLLKIAQQGVEATSLTPCFPSKTFPNHYSIITGLYPENHGIVANHFYDPKSDDYYSSRQPNKVQDGNWYGGVPLWLLADRNDLKSAAYFWVGSEAKIQGQRPTYYKNYDPDVSGESITSQIIDWLKLPIADRPQFISAYFSAVDAAGHRFGTDSPELEKAVQEMDLLIGDLYRQIQLLDLPINLIILSDHGMTNINTTAPVYYEDFINTSEVTYIPRDAFFMIYEKDSMKNKAIYDTLKLHENGKYKTFRKAEVSSLLHFQNNDRIGDIVVIANSPYVFAARNASTGVGTHGYDPAHEDMKGIFYAVGPHIRPAQKIASFENIHIYPFVADLLNIPYDTTSIDGNAKVLGGIVLDQ